MKCWKYIVLTSFMFLSSCQNKETSCYIYDYKDVSHIEWNQIFDINQDEYYIYVYSLKCGHCKEIKQEIISFAVNNENVYFVLYKKEIPVVDSSYVLIGRDKYEDVGIIGTPTLFEISSHIVSDVHTGSEAIIKTLSNKN